MQVCACLCKKPKLIGVVSVNFYDWEFISGDFIIYFQNIYFNVFLLLCWRSNQQQLQKLVSTKTLCWVSCLWGCHAIFSFLRRIVFGFDFIEKGGCWKDVILFYFVCLDQLKSCKLRESVGYNIQDCLSVVVSVDGCIVALFACALCNFGWWRKWSI